MTGQPEIIAGEGTGTELRKAAAVTGRAASTSGELVVKAHLEAQELAHAHRQPPRGTASLLSTHLVTAPKIERATIEDSGS